MALKDRLKRLEGGMEYSTPWWTLPPGVEPDWPRPFKDVPLEVLEAVGERELVFYFEAREGERETPQPTRARVYTSNEAWHEVRWRKHGIARRAGGGQMPQPVDRSEVERVLEKARDFLAERGPLAEEEDEQGAGSPLESYFRAVEHHRNEKGVRDV